MLDDELLRRRGAEVGGGAPGVGVLAGVLAEGAGLAPTALLPTEACADAERFNAGFCATGIAEEAGALVGAAPALVGLVTGVAAGLDTVGVARLDRRADDWAAVVEVGVVTGARAAGVAGPGRAGVLATDVVGAGLGAA